LTAPAGTAAAVVPRRLPAWSYPVPNLPSQTLPIPSPSVPARRQSAHAEPSPRGEAPQREAARATHPAIGLRPPEIAGKPLDTTDARLSEAQAAVSPPRSRFDLPPAIVEAEGRPHELPRLPQMTEGPTQVPPRKEAAFTDATPPARTPTTEIVRERAEVRYVSAIPSDRQTLPVSEAGDASNENSAALRKQPALEVPHLPAPEVRSPEQLRRLSAVKSDKMPAEPPVRPPAETLSLVAPREDSTREAPLLRPALQPHLHNLRPENNSDPRVTVHIGTLEIRALDPKLNLQAQASTPAAPLPSPAGFDAFSHLRSYEPWPR
jgi:hypothetical protein